MAGPQQRMHSKASLPAGTGATFIRKPAQKLQTADLFHGLS